MNLKEKQKLGNTIFKRFWFMMFLIFLTLYVSQASGYYEYEIRKKATFTEEQIKKFEQDIKDGKEIDVEQYISHTNKNYQNKLSSSVLLISEMISKYTKLGIEKVFSIIGQAVEGDE